MKQRVTYIVRNEESGFDPSNIEVEKRSLRVSNLAGSREQHVTFGLQELPDEIRSLLTKSNELYVRWTSSKPYTPKAPYISRIGPGLHVFFSPLQDIEPPGVCRATKTLFGRDIKCASVDETFTTPPILSGRFSHSTSRQFYAYIPSLEPFVNYLTRVICGPTADRCKSDSRELLDADYLDIDWDSISHTLVLKAFWSQSSLEGAVWQEKHILPQGDHALEVGVLTNETPDEVEELKYSGFLTQVGKDSKFSNVLFSFPSRHHPLSSGSTFSTQFNEPTGLHPTLKITSHAGYHAAPPKESCALHTYLTLPSSIFLDRYPLSDPLTLASHNLRALHSVSGATDLEAPDYLTPQWGSAALFEVDTSSAGDKGSNDFSFTVPLHLRYLSPSSNGTRDIAVPDPVLFWACPAEEYGKYAASPFERVNLGYEGLFGPKTIFYHFSPISSTSSGVLVQTVRVPVLDLGQAWYVEWGTVIAVLFGVLLVGLPLVRVLFKEFGARRQNFQASAKADERKKKK